MNVVCRLCGKSFAKNRVKNINYILLHCNYARILRYKVFEEVEVGMMGIWRSGPISVQPFRFVIGM